MSKRRRPLPRALVPAALFVLMATAFVVRVVPPWSTVFPAPGEIRLFDTDPYYHLRHARFVAAHFPRVERWDLALYPDGERALYAGLYDVAIGGAALVVGGGHADGALVERVAAFTPPVLGALAFVGLFWLGRLVCGAGGGLLAGLLLTLAPAFFLVRSLVGYPDHHVAEAFLAVLTVAGLTRCLGASPARRWRPAPLLALPLALFLFTWYGAALYVLLIGVTLFVVATIRIAVAGSADDVGRAAFRYALGALVVIAPIALAAPWLILEGGMLGKVGLALALLGVGLPLYARAARAACRRVSPRVVALVAAVLAAGLFAIAMRMRYAGLSFAHYLFGSKNPLVSENAGIGVRDYLRLGGASAVVALAALPIALRDAFRGRDRGVVLAPVLLGSLIVALWLATHDYAYLAPPFLAFMAAFVLVRAARWVTAPRWRAAGAVAIAVALIAPMWPLRFMPPPYPEADTLRGVMILDEGWVQALRWMKQHTPPPTLPIDAEVTGGPHFHEPPGNYGVRAFWDFGHYIAAIGERPALALGAISGSLAQWYLSESEQSALAADRAWLRPGQEIRYVFADGRTAGDFFPAALRMVGVDEADYRTPGGRTGLWTYNDRYRRTMIARLYLDDGDYLGHFRLVYASPLHSALAYLANRKPDGKLAIARIATPLISDARTRAWQILVRRQIPTGTPFGIVYGARILPAVKLFEEVRGARLVGTAAPYANIQVTLALHATAAGDDVQWRGGASADGRGRFEIRAPYPTERDYSDVVALGPYVVTASQHGAQVTLGQVDVPAAAVRTGAEVAVAP